MAWCLVKAQGLYIPHIIPLNIHFLLATFIYRLSILIGASLSGIIVPSPSGAVRKTKEYAKSAVDSSKYNPDSTLAICHEIEYIIGEWVGW
jgi:hypothetical protein